MKLFIRFCLFSIALICFSHNAISQKKNKKKANTTVSSKKKSTKKSSSKKKNSKKKSSNNKQKNKQRSTVSKYLAPTKLDHLLAVSDIPSKFNSKDSMPEKVVTIVSAFKPQLKNIAKIGFTNATALVDTNTVVLAYQVPSQNLSFQYQPIALIPRALKRDSASFMKQSAHFKVGAGNYQGQLIQLKASLMDLKNQIHSFNVLNETLKGDHPIQQWKNLSLNYVGTLSVNKNKQLNSQLFYNQSSWYRYGLVPDTTKLPLDNFEQKLSLLGLKLALSNKLQTNRFVNFSPILELNQENLYNQAKNLSIHLTSPIDIKINSNFKLHNDFTLAFNQYRPMNHIAIQNYYVQMDPSVNLNFNNFRLALGVRPTYSNGDFSLYPKIELEKQLKDTNIILQIGWKTSLSNNMISQLMTQNQWIIAPESLPITTIESKYFKVNLVASKRLNYGFDMALNDYRELPFFNQTLGTNNPAKEGLKIDVLFEKRAIAIELNGHLRYQISDKLLWKNHFKYIQFSHIRENKQAWGILPLELISDLKWNYNQRLNFEGSAQFWTGSKSSTRSEQAFKLNNTFVLNAGMQYNLNKKWTIWAKGENLLDQQYQRWANYPSLGVQFIAGIQFKFSK